MRKPEQQEILEALRAGRAALGDALAGVDEAMAARTPPAGGWSILGCVEHMAVAEEYLLGRLRAGSMSDRSHYNPAREAKIADRALNRERRIESPQEAWPSGRYGSLEEALSFFDSVRAQTVRFVEEFEGDPRCWLTDHPLAASPVNYYEMLSMIALHPVRHAKQIMNIRAGLAAHGPQG